MANQWGPREFAVRNELGRPANEPTPKALQLIAIEMAAANDQREAMIQAMQPEVLDTAKIEGLSAEGRAHLDELLQGHFEESVDFFAPTPATTGIKVEPPKKKRLREFLKGDKVWLKATILAGIDSDETMLVSIKGADQVFIYADARAKA